MRTVNRCALTIAVIASLLGCHHDSDDYSLTSPAVTNALTLVAPEASSIPADGRSEIPIEARISADAASNRRSVKFTTTAGTLVRSPGQAAPASPGSVIVTVDENGVARVYLRSDTRSGVAIVEAVVEAAAERLLPRRLEITFTPVSSSDVIRISTEKSTLPADGRSRTEVYADVIERGLSVDFTTSLGTFGGGTSPTAAAISDSNGRATAVLVSNTTVGRARLTAAARGVLVETAVEFVEVNDASVIRIGASRGVVPADDATVIQVFADVAPGSGAVTFTSSLGSFSATGSADPQNGRATVNLKAGRVTGSARLTATAGQATASTFVEFVRALPEAIVVNIDQTTLKADPAMSAVITVRLLRSVGKVSDGTIPEYAAFNAQTGENLHFLFRAKVPSTDGTASARVSAPDASFTGTAIIRVTVPEASLSGEETILVVP